MVHDWDAHKRLLTDFWASVVLRAGSYRGNPMAAHRALPQVRAEHFEQWLALWAATTAEVLGAAAAAQMQDYAARIGTGLRMGLGLAPVSGRGLGVPLVNAPLRSSADAATCGRRHCVCSTLPRSSSTRRRRRLP